MLVKNKIYGASNINHVSDNIEFIKLFTVLTTEKLHAIICCNVFAIYNLKTFELGPFAKFCKTPRVLLIVLKFSSNGNSSLVDQTPFSVLKILISTGISLIGGGVFVYGAKDKQVGRMFVWATLPEYKHNAPIKTRIPIVINLVNIPIKKL